MAPDHGWVAELAKTTPPGQLLTVERGRSLPVLLIVTFRPEFQPPWTGQPQVTMLALNRLDRRERAALIAQIAGGKGLPEFPLAKRSRPSRARQKGIRPK